MDRTILADAPDSKGIFAISTEISTSTSTMSPFVHSIFLRNSFQALLDCSNNRIHRRQSANPHFSTSQCFDLRCHHLSAVLQNTSSAAAAPESLNNAQLLLGQWMLPRGCVHCRSQQRWFARPRTASQIPSTGHARQGVVVTQSLSLFGC